MKKLFIVILVLSTFQSLAKNLSVGWELWYPYQYRNKEQQLVGLDFDILNAINKQLQYSINYMELPWKRHLQYIKTGYIDLAMGASFTANRSEDAYFTVPYRIEQVNLFIKKENPQNIKITALSQISKSHLIFGIEGGYFYGKVFEDLINQPGFHQHINEVIDLEQNIKMLLKGHIDGFLADPLAVKAFAKRYDIENKIEIYPLEIYKTNIHFMISKKSVDKDMLIQINKAIEVLKNSGEMDNLINNFTNSDVLQKSNLKW